MLNLSLVGAGRVMLNKFGKSLGWPEGFVSSLWENIFPFFVFLAAFFVRISSHSDP